MTPNNCFHRRAPDRTRLLRDLCLEMATGHVGSERFNNLLIQTGVFLDNDEWEATNRLLGRSEQLLVWYDSLESTRQ